MLRLARMRLPLLAAVALLFVFAPAALATATAPAPGTWSLTGALTTARESHTSTLLFPEGLLLVAGGLNDSGILASAELFDPQDTSCGNVNGCWRQTASMNEIRDNHTATRLPDGRVLVAGGFQGPAGSNPTGSTELYDPTTGMWTVAGNLHTPRGQHTASLLNDGRVLVAGGWNDHLENAFVATAEIFDLLDTSCGNPNGCWTQVGSLTTGRYGHTETVLENGQVLVAGGFAFNFVTLASAEVFDVTTGEWLETAPLRTARYNHTAERLDNGQVLVAGGFNDQETAGYLASAELYDPATGSWRPTGNLNVGRSSHTSIRLNDGRVQVAGGDGHAGDLASTEIYQPASGTWSVTGNMQVERVFHRATLIPMRGEVVVSGGCCSDQAPHVLGSAERYIVPQP